MYLSEGKIRPLLCSAGSQDWKWCVVRCVELQQVKHMISGHSGKDCKFSFQPGLAE